MKKTPIKKIQELLWKECRRIVRERYKHEDGTWSCFTCGRLIDEPSKAQTGHFIPSSTCGAYLRYDLRNLRIQDYFCNINCGGAGAEFYRKLVQEKGQDHVDEIFKDKAKIVNAYDRYSELLEEYKKI